MKKIITLLAFSIGILSFSQEFKVVGDDYTFTQIIDIPGKNKIDIYKGIKLFLNDSSKRAKNFIDTDDSNIGIISYNEKTPYFPISEFFSISGSYKVTIDIKDNKFRYSVNNFKILQNIVGSDISLTYPSFIAIKDSENKKLELEQKLSKETNPKKQQSIKEELSKIEIEKRMSEIALNKIKDIIKDNPSQYTNSINNSSSDW
ncbi:DUF4468 domain-containing protein [Elizabethkingia meningoseptica]|uniref:DUF4468 domain-containing protein n=1 Tax=Elizabethkingia meningoseptica TaxID=238 RepID=UPI0022F1AA7D|nr:DUF4468 domain-containing protein [Elizabethkingia meningoseptica]EJK5330511.1 DUF4468 domain-containing protein [Elizabethkingia meningoseptica]WBS75706.1 DUF4468 domain-containing protein [Elizabethkingia meningoseptica]